MQFQHDFGVDADPDEVFRTLLDLERVTPNVPGAQLVTRDGADSAKVAIKVKVGPVAMQYRGDVQVLERDDTARAATLRVRAKETRGQGTADSTVKLGVEERPSGSHVQLDTEVALTGRAARMGHGIIADVSQRLIGQFAANLEGSLAPAPSATSDGQAPPPEAPGNETARTSATVPVPRERPQGTAANELGLGSLVARSVVARLGERRALIAASATLAAVVLGMRRLAVGR